MQTDTLRGKRLLFLGAVGGMVYAVKKAREMGVYTIVADYYQDSQAKEYCDKSYLISTSDLEAIDKIIDEERVDGIFTGFSDVNLRNAETLCKRHGFPCYVTREQIRYTQDKNLFKKLCIQNQVPTPRSYTETSDDIVFPVIVKPSDAYAAKGITVCADAQALRNAVEYARSFSRNGEVTIEEYIEGNEVMIHFIMINGQLKISSAYDRIIYDAFSGAGKAMAPILIYNQKTFADAACKVEAQLEKMYQSIDFRNAVGFLQGKINDDGMRFFEMALRFGGNVSEIFNMHFSDVDLIACFIEYALTGQMPEAALQRVTPYWPGFACNVTLFMNPGTVAQMVGEDYLRSRPCVLDIQRYGSIGDEIREEIRGTYAAIAYRLVIACGTKEEYIREIRDMIGKVSVLDTEGREMLDWEQILEKFSSITMPHNQ